MVVTEHGIGIHLRSLQGFANGNTTFLFGRREVFLPRFLHLSKEEIIVLDNL